MPTTTLMPSPRQRFVDNNGWPLVSGMVFTFEAGTSKPLATFQDPAGLIPHKNPIRLDSRGEATIYWSGNYKVDVRSAAGVQVRGYPVDNFNTDPGGLWNSISGLITNLAKSTGAAMLGFIQSGAGAVKQTVQDVLRERVSITNFGGVGDGLVDNSAAALLAEARTDYVYLPDGQFLIAPTTILTKRYYGPGRLVFGGLGAVSFAGGGLNDLSLSGAFLQSRPLQIVVKVNTTGTPDTIAYSLNGGVTFYDTVDVFDPVTDQVTPQPIKITAGPIDLQGTGVKLQFGATTGHSTASRWAFTLAPHPHVAETQSGVVTKGNAPIMGVNGVNDANTFMGAGALGNLNNAGNQLTAIGYQTLFSNTTGYANTAIGISALWSNTSGFNNTAVGADALHGVTTGYNNVGVGIYSGRDITTGRGNVGLGADSNRYQTTGSSNTAVGDQALYHNKIGEQNVAIGTYALRSGSESLSNGSSVSYSTAAGVRALTFCRANYNTAFGHEAAYNVTSGPYNTMVGAASGLRTTSGGYNVFVGYNAGAHASQSPTAQNCVVLGDSAYTTGDNGIAIGSAVVADANQIVIGNSSHYGIFHYGGLRPQLDGMQTIGSGGARYSVVYAATGSINTSDEREKQQVRDIEAAALRAWGKVKFRQFKFNDAVAIKGDGARWHFGVIAQKVKEAFESEGLDAFAYGLLCYDEWPQNGDNPAGNRYGVRYEEALALECAYLRSKLQT